VGSLRVQNQAAAACSHARATCPCATVAQAPPNNGMSTSTRPLRAVLVSTACTPASTPLASRTVSPR
jgi:hypothetical protein